jgi:hypothetical protein
MNHKSTGVQEEIKESQLEREKGRFLTTGYIRRRKEKTSELRRPSERSRPFLVASLEYPYFM